MSNTITAYFKGRVGVAEALYQNDYGIVMQFDGIYLPAHFDCYFSVSGAEEAIPGVGSDNRVAIPNAVLANSGKVAVHIPLHTGTSDSEVEYIAYFRVIGRARPIDDGTPVQMTAIEQALALLQTPIGNIEQIVNEALAFTGDTFDEMQDALDADQAAFKEEVRGDIADVESDFDNLNAQFQTAVSAVTTDTEVTNIRVGADNVTYTTAGEAVRTQFTNLKSDFTDLKTDLATYNMAINIVPNSYVSIVGVIYDYNGWSRTDYIEIPHDVWTLNITATSQSQYNVFYDENKRFISAFTLSVGENTVRVPSIAKYVMLSGVTANVNELIVKSGATYNDIADDIEVVAKDLYLEETDGGSAYLKFDIVYILHRFRNTPSVAKTFVGVKNQGVWTVKSKADIPDCITVSDDRWFCYSFADDTFKYCDHNVAMDDSQIVILLGMRPQGKSLFGRLLETSYADQFRKTIMPRYKLTDESFMSTVRAKEASVVELQTADTFCFGFLTDLHSYYDNSSYPNLTSLYMNQVDRDIDLDAVINGGDTVIHGTNDLEKGIASLTIPLAYIDNKQKMLVAKGNHDANGHSASGVTQQEVSWTLMESMFFSVAQRHLLNDSSVHFGNGVYFYKDYDAQKVRVIVVNSCDAGEEINGSYMAVDSLRVCGIRQTQLEWLANTALDFSNKTDASQWHTIVISHIAFENVEHSYPTVQNEQLIHNLLVAFKNGQNFSGSYTDTNYDGLFSTSISVDFRTQGAMNLVGVFSGHNHADKMVNTGYEQVTTMSGYVDESMASTEETGRTYLGIDEMAFDVVTVNKATKKVTLTRFGCGSDREYTY